MTASRIPDGWDESVLALRGLHRVEAQARIAIGDEAFDEALAKRNSEQDRECDEGGACNAVYQD